MKKNAVIGICLWVLSVGPVMAGISCSEEIVRLIVYQDGTVYFSTDQTCPSWCELDWTSEDQVSRGYSMLLAADTLDASIRFQWPDINACTETNAAYASPSYFMTDDF